MAAFKKPIATTLVAGVCFVAVGSAAAFALGANPRAESHHRGPRVTAACSSSVCSSTMAGAAMAEPTGPADPVLYVPSVIIAAPWPQGAAGR